MQNEQKENKKMQNTDKPTEFVEMGFSLKNRFQLWVFEYNVSSLSLSAHNEKVLIWMLTSSIWEKTISFPILKAKGLKIDQQHYSTFKKPNQKT